ncbi:MAG: ammonium transporter, partial [Rhodospirillaceae bacterium]|nr:ammonium transporter [Rhodospirillaceae bacterium]
ATRYDTGGEDAGGWVDGNFAQILPQISGVLATIVWTGVLTVVILVVVRAITGLRVSEEIERGSLDLELHGETVQ